MCLLSPPDQSNTTAEAKQPRHFLRGFTEMGFIPTPCYEIDRAPTARQILESRAILTYFQPILSARQKCVVGVEGLSRGLIGVEALSRGAAETIEKLIPPAVLFELAEREGLSAPIEQLCRETAVRSFANLICKKQDLILFLNFDLSMLSETGNDAHRTRDLVAAYNIRPQQVAIEILESKIDDTKKLQSILAHFREYGFLLVLDDVGTGHSNLDRIPLIKPDVLKVDRSLIANIDSDYHKQETLKSLIHLSRKIGALVVAEGIETEDEAIVALELGSDLLQGFFLGRPERAGTAVTNPAATIDALARRYKSYMVEKINLRKLQHRKFNIIMNQILCDLTNAHQYDFDQILSKTILQHAGVECVYVLDESGVQVTDTICNPDMPRRENGIIFSPAPRGADHSLKEYYFVLLDVELQKYTTDPYVSLASGSVCRTISICFRDAENNRMYVLCIDVLCE